MKIKYLKTISSIIFLAIIFTQCSTDTVNKEPMNKEKKDRSNNIESSNMQSKTSEITCPECGNKSTEVLPTDVCAIIYTCENCKTELTPKDGDCCVFCTYGTHKCPSMQDE